MTVKPDTSRQEQVQEDVTTKRQVMLIKSIRSQKRKSGALELQASRKGNVKLLEEIMRSGKREFRFASGFSPSGPMHLGALREVLLIDFMGHILLAKEPSFKVQLCLLIDDMDPLRRVPSAGNRYLGDANMMGVSYRDIMSKYPRIKEMVDEDIAQCVKLVPNLRVIRTYELYESEEMGNYKKIAISQTKKIKEYLKDHIDSYQEYIPVWAQCDGVWLRQGRYKQGKLLYDGKSYSILGTQGKLQGRFEWAAKGSILKVDFEPFGKDHIGPSGDNSQGISRNIYEHEPPIGFAYEYITVDNGKKMSSSQSNFPKMQEIIAMGPTGLLKHWLISKPYMSKDFTPGKFIHNIQKIVDEVKNYKHLSKEARIYEAVHYVFDGKIPFQIENININKLLRFISYINFPKEVDAEEVYDYCRGRSLFKAFFGMGRLPNVFREIFICCYKYYMSEIITGRTEERIVTNEMAQKINLLLEKMYVNINDARLAEVITKLHGKDFFYHLIAKNHSGPSFSELLNMNMRSIIIDILQEAVNRRKYKFIKWDEVFQS